MVGIDKHTEIYREEVACSELFFIPLPHIRGRQTLVENWVPWQVGLWERSADGRHQQTRGHENGGQGISSLLSPRFRGLSLAVTVALLNDSSC